MSVSSIPIIRLLVVGVVVVAAALPAYNFALVSFLRVAQPDVALAHSPYDSTSLSKTINRRIKKSGSYVANTHDERAAITSLVAAPLSRSSLRIIGMNADLREEPERAAAAMNLAGRVSRRDTMAQAWLLEKAVARSEFEPALEHYHAALSVTPELKAVLNPILVMAVKFPEVRPAIRPYLQDSTRWAPTFLTDASADAAPLDLYDLILPVAGRLSDEAFHFPIARVARRLAADGHWEEAMVLAEATWNDFSTQEFASPAPAKVTTDKRLGNLAWSLTTSKGINARVIQNGTLDVSMAPLSRGTIAYRELALQGGGKYSLTQRVKFFGSSEMARLNWQADCIFAADVPGKRVWSQRIPARSDATTYRSTLSIPADCNLLALKLSGTGPESQRQSSFNITEIEFVRARQ